jgi:acyl dehydratase
MKVGQKARRSKTVTARDVELTPIMGPNPLHFDAARAGTVGTAQAGPSGS